MEKPKNLYHNEVIGALSIASILKHGELSFAKGLLVLPLVFHKDTLAFISDNSIHNIKSIVSKRSNLISNFNSRYYSLLSISINSILIGKELKLFKFENNQLVNNQENLPWQSLGSRIQQISNVSSKVSEILTANTNELYFHLKIKI